MGKTIQIRVDESLAQVLERVRKEIVNGFKKQYKLNEVTIHGTLASQVAAAKMSGKKFLNFKIKKNGKQKGILHLV